MDERCEVWGAFREALKTHAVAILGAENLPVEFAEELADMVGLSAEDEVREIRKQQQGVD